jgi:hypothetical protein
MHASIHQQICHIKQKKKKKCTVWLIRQIILKLLTRVSRVHQIVDAGLLARHRNVPERTSHVSNVDLAGGVSAAIETMGQ